MTLPVQTHTLVLGGGTAGCAVAGLLAEHTDAPILLLEAGPDYGPRERWPADVLRADDLCLSHDWGLTDTLSVPGRRIELPRGRLLGGSSSINGCAAIWGTAADYDAWAARGLPGWSAEDLRPLFIEAERRFQVHIATLDELTPFQRACLDGAVALGIPLVKNLNDLDDGEGVAPSPRNIVGATRWNAAFAFLDPVRSRPNLTICADTLVERVLIEGGRAVGAVVISQARRQIVRAERVVLAAGAYGSPEILLRSGIGDPAQLAAAGVPLVHALPGVGRNLHDHSAFVVEYTGTAALQRAMEEFAEHRTPFVEQVIVKLRSRPEREPFDLHIYPCGGFSPSEGNRWIWQFPVGLMEPRSRGELRITGPEPSAVEIRHGYFTDPEGHDLQAVLDGVAWVRRLAATTPLRDLLGDELTPGPGVQGAELAEYVARQCFHYYHPVGTCAMGPAGDPEAVVGGDGKVHGLRELYVADASIMPVVPRANTNLPAAVVGMKVAHGLLARR